MLFGTDTRAVAAKHYSLLMQIHGVSVKNVAILFIFVTPCQISPDFANTWQKHSTGNLKHSSLHLVLYVHTVPCKK